MTPLRAVLVEDDPADAELVAHELSAAGFDLDWTRVQTEAELVAVLVPPPDVVLVDNSLPGFGALPALAALRSRGIDAPLIVVSGTLDDERAVALLREGAADYILKDRMARLGEAVTAAIERRRLEADVREAEARYRLLVERMPAVTYIAEIGEDPTQAARRVFVSPQIEHMLGYAPAEIQDDPGMWLRLIHPEDRGRMSIAHRQHFERAEPLDEEYRMLARDGREVWVHDRATIEAETTTHPRRSQGVILDVTERTEFERALQRSEERSRQLLRSLVEAQETERARIASDLHDGPIQTMVGTVFHLLTLRPSLADASDLELFDTIHDAVQQSISEMRTLLFDLRPMILDEVGLAAAIREHIGLSRFDFDVDVDEGFDQEPPREVRTVMYRIILETLANARKHANAKLVTIRLANDTSGYEVVVRDDGRGFEATSTMSGHLGLRSIRERAESAGGHVEVNSTIGAGTTVTLSIPSSGSLPEP